MVDTEILWLTWKDLSSSAILTISFKYYYIFLKVPRAFFIFKWKHELEEQKLMHMAECLLHVHVVSGHKLAFLFKNGIKWRQQHEQFNFSGTFLLDTTEDNQMTAMIHKR